MKKILSRINNLVLLVIVQFCSLVLFLTPDKIFLSENYRLVVLFTGLASFILFVITNKIKR